MLRFIVLGQVPGTQFQINFNQLLVFALLALFFYELFLGHHRFNITEQTDKKPAKKADKTARKSSRKKSSVKKSAKSTRSKKTVAKRRKSTAKRKATRPRKLAEASF